MKKSTSSSRICSMLFITGLFILELSYHSVLFAGTGPSLSWYKILPIKITQGLLIYTTAEGEELIEAANGTIIN